MEDDEAVVTLECLRVVVRQRLLEEPLPRIVPGSALRFELEPSEHAARVRVDDECPSPRRIQRDSICSLGTDAVSREEQRANRFERKCEEGREPTGALDRSGRRAKAARLHARRA